MRGVSIPQSGFGAFEPIARATAVLPRAWFQSLSRDSGRLNDVHGHLSFNQNMFQSLSRDSGRLNLPLYVLALQ